MNAGSGPKTFFLAAALDGRLRFPGLVSTDPWDASRLTYVTCWTAQDLEAFSRRRWLVLSVDELDHILTLSHGLPAAISLYIMDTLLSQAYQKWEGTVPY